MKKLFVLFCFVLFCFNGKAQPIANYVTNGSFEELYNDTIPVVYFWRVNSWDGIDTIHCPGGGAGWLCTCNGSAPVNSYGMQYPHSGSAYLIATIYYLHNNGVNTGRPYLRNRLKATLQAGKAYCVRFYVNITNVSTYGIDGFGVYFGNNGLDTITTCLKPLTYLMPQVQNPNGNIITDTLNWIPITGTFTANGTEKYLLFGNFLYDNNIDTLMINPTYLPIIATDVNIDDVSCIEIDLPAYAGRDTTILIGDSVYIGRDIDFAIDNGCMWYQLPNTTTAIDTISGMWVKPAVTTTYVVKQELECSAVKWDTVVVSVGYVGIGEVKSEKLEVEIYPNPASDILTIECKSKSEELAVTVFDVIGRIVFTEKVKPKNYVANLKLDLGKRYVSYKHQYEAECRCYKEAHYFKMRIFKICLLLCLIAQGSAAQRIGNYVANGSFEEYYDCSLPLTYGMANAKNWQTIDSIGGGAIWLSACNGKVPKKGNLIYQYPRSGQSYILATFYLPILSQYQRGYPKNRLKATLQAGKTYCVTFYVNVENGCSYGIDGIGAYFGNSEIDTITKCNIPLSYITPQVQNPHSNIIKDTLNWVPITGTFTANGTEKYLLLGNFLSDVNTDTLMINPTNLPDIFSEINIDDVSCIEVNLSAYAGRDTTILIGDSVYIGRDLDFAIDSHCVWYQLPNMTSAIDTTSGMWVKPTVTTTYVVRQELECSAVKWDTVVVSVGYVGIGEVKSEKLEVEIYPNPASDKITLTSNKPSEELSVSIVDVTGRLVMSRKAEIKSYVSDVELYLANGAYLIIISNGKHGNLTKKLLIAK